MLHKPFLPFAATKHKTPKLSAMANLSKQAPYNTPLQSLPIHPKLFYVEQLWSNSQARKTNKAGEASSVPGSSTCFFFSYDFTPLIVVSGRVPQVSLLRPGIKFVRSTNPDFRPPPPPRISASALAVSASVALGCPVNANLAIITPKLKGTVSSGGLNAEKRYRSHSSSIGCSDFPV